jgi:hypothetical protein
MEGGGKKRMKRREGIRIGKGKEEGYWRGEGMRRRKERVGLGENGRSR